MKPPSAKKVRIDELLVIRGLADSLAMARAFIMEGKVVANEQRVDKASLKIGPDAEVRVKLAGKYVSRGGEKLEGALIDLGLNGLVKGAIVLDIGASTGGFTDCCLSHGAEKVIALDVGSNQLAWKLRQDPRVVALEKTDIRDFKNDGYGEITWVVADVSFNSLARLLPSIKVAVPATGVHFLLLIKPQFELERHEVAEGGVVVDEALRLKAVGMVEAALNEIALPRGKAIDSRLSGQQGNREIFYYFKT